MGLEADSEEALGKAVDHALGWEIATRVRFHVSEAFTNGLADAVELFTGFGGGDCGILFRAGETYLVFAHRDENSGRWIGTICSGTFAFPYAEQDARTLRAWKAGLVLPPRIYGSVWKSGRDDDEEEAAAPDVEIHLLGNDVSRTAFTDMYGRIAFDGLARSSIP